MDLNLVDAELISTFDVIPEFDIWAYLSVTCLLSLKRNTHLA